MKEKIPNVAITTDIIVGFPGETDEDFKETLDVVDKCKYDGAYTFIYSPRVGTPAAVMKDQVDEKIKADRLKELNEHINKYSLESNQKYLNKECKVLIDGKSEKGKNKVCGYTETMKLVNVTGSEDLIGKVVRVKIKEAKSFSLDGEYIEL